MATANGYTGQVEPEKFQSVKVSKKKRKPIVVSIPPGTSNPGFLPLVKNENSKINPGISTNSGQKVLILIMSKSKTLFKMERIPIKIRITPRVKLRLYIKKPPIDKYYTINIINLLLILCYNFTTLSYICKTL
jgi:hypothetical protein